MDSVPAKREVLPPSQPYTWQSRLMISTSGLGVAMSEESLRSLTYCLTWLRWANERLGNSIIALKKVLQEWDASQQARSSDDTTTENHRPRSPTSLSQQIQQVKGDVLQTLKQAIDIVSKYAGGALPENARNLVRRHLTSLPQRFRIASSSALSRDTSAPRSDMATSAHRVLVLAEEGLDMMAQVSGVVNDTLVSAEGWCQKLRRPRTTPGGANADQQLLPNTVLQLGDTKVPLSDPQQDVEMTGVEKR
jgi:hypothetical protein